MFALPTSFLFTLPFGYLILSRLKRYDKDLTGGLDRGRGGA